MNANLLRRFIEQHNYDIRVSRNGRWIDQKCALDEVCFVSDCIVDYLQNGGVQPFQSPDIWRSPYASENVQRLFNKPDPSNYAAHDEYNKFFRQPMKMLAAAGVLREDGVVRNTIQFSVENEYVLEYIALRERNAFDFLCMYIQKTLQDSGLWDAFETFFDEQTEASLSDLKSYYTEFCIRYTPINTKVEVGRIFAKVLNPLACEFHKKGTERGRLSRYMITFDKLMYNKPNWRDEAIGKEKNIPRSEYNPLTPDSDWEWYDYRVEKAKRKLRAFNDLYHNSKSEVVDRLSVGASATHMHHIFPKSQYKEIAAYIENLIALTSGQHLQLAHPNGNTKIVDKDYQYHCLVCKTESIRHNLLDGEEPQFYDFDDFMYVLDTGFQTDYFSHLYTNDFSGVLTGIDFNMAID